MHLVYLMTIPIYLMKVQNPWLSDNQILLAKFACQGSEATSAAEATTRMNFACTSNYTVCSGTMCARPAG